MRLTQENQEYLRESLKIMFISACLLHKNDKINRYYWELVVYEYVRKIGLDRKWNEKDVYSYTIVSHKTIEYRK